MRMQTVIFSGVAGIALLSASTLNAQAPATGTPGAAMPQRPATFGGAAAGRRPQSSSGPSRYAPSLGGTASGGIGLSGVGRSGSPRRQPRRSSTPVLSPYLNLDADFNASVEGQYLMRTLPQEDYNRTQQQTQRAFNNVQGEIGQQQLQIQSGLNTTGHSTTFMNLGRYFP